MNSYLAFTLFSLFILIYWAISEFFTMLFRFTGVPDEKARFQVVSLLTGCGYRHKSELFLSSRSRRRLARTIMLFGYVFNVTINSALVNVFFSLKISEVVSDLISILIPMLAAVVIMLFIRIPKIRSWGERILEKLVGKILKRENENTVLLLDYLGNDSIAQVNLNQVPDAFSGLSQSKSGIKANYGILVMLIDRGKAEPAGADSVFREGDKLTVFGDYKKILDVFEAHEQFGE